MRHNKLIALAAALSALLATALPAGALTGGQLDGETHPAVALVFAAGEPACSAVLVAPAVLATAAHCAPEGRVTVTFASVAGADGSLGTLHAHPQFDPRARDTHDLAVVVLDDPAPVPPLALAPEATLDALRKGTVLTTVGYGLSGDATSLGYDGARRNGTVALAKASRSEVTVEPLSASHCFGDSGGPILLDGEILALTSGAKKATCDGRSVGYRVDTPTARAFLGRWL